MVEGTEVVVIVAVHHRLITEEDAMTAHGHVLTHLVDINLLAPDWGLRFHLRWTNFHCIIVLCPPK